MGKPAWTEDMERRIKVMEEGERGLVQSLGKLIGFGNMMDLASRIWAEEDVGDAAFVVGPAKAFVVECPCESPKDCEWCCGANWITKGVADLLEDRAEGRG